MLKKALTHMNLVDHELAAVAGNSTSVQTLKLLVEDAIQSSQSGDTTNSLVHLNQAYQLLSAPASNAKIASASKAQNKVTNFLTYENPILGVRISYPSDWLIREYSYNPAANNTVVGFFSPSKTASALGNISGVSGSFVPYVDIFVFASKNMSLDKIVKGTINNFLTSRDFALNQSKLITLTGNQPAHMLVYSVTGAQDEFFKKMQVWAIVGGKVYVITFTSEAALYPNYLLTVQKMINSFEIRKTTATTG
jgi:PsbP-like protein